MSSIPIAVLFLSPPEIPRIICVPTCRSEHLWFEGTSGDVHLCSLNIQRAAEHTTYLGVSHFGQAQLLDEVCHPSVLLLLANGVGEPQGGTETEVLPYGECAHEHVILGEPQSRTVNMPLQGYQQTTNIRSTGSTELIYGGEGIGWQEGIQFYDFTIQYFNQNEKSTVQVEQWLRNVVGLSSRRSFMR